MSARRREGGRQAGEVLSTLGRACARDVVEDDAGSAVCEGQGRRGAQGGAGAGGLWLQRRLGAGLPSKAWSAMVRSNRGRAHEAIGRAR